MTEKTCGRCGQRVRTSAMVGDYCPHCKAQWSNEKTFLGTSRSEMTFTEAAPFMIVGVLVVLGALCYCVSQALSPGAAVGFLLGAGITSGFAIWLAIGPKGDIGASAGCMLGCAVPMALLGAVVLYGWSFLLGF